MKNKQNTLSQKVSIAMCTYNGETYLSQQLDSIINQTYPYITEIVCVDDNSTDNTFECLQEYALRDSRFKIFKNNTNLGYIKNFERAFSLTINPFIAIADQDDIWNPNKISQLINTIGDNMLVYSDNEYIDNQNSKLGKRFSEFRNLKTCNSCLNFVLYNGISGHTALFNRELLKYAIPFDNFLPYDHWLAFHASQHGIIPYVDEVLVQYRQHENNIIGASYLKKESTQKYSKQYQLQTFSNAALYATSAERLILNQLANINNDYSLSARIKKVGLFWKNRKNLLFFQKRNNFRKAFFCLKMAWTEK